MNQLQSLQNELETKRRELVELTQELQERVLKGRKSNSLERVSKKISELIKVIAELENDIKNAETNIIVAGEYTIKETDSGLTVVNESLQLEASFIKVNEYKVHRDECRIENKLYYPNSYERSVKDSAYWIQSKGAIQEGHKKLLEEMENVIIDNVDRLNMKYLEIR